MKTEFKYSFKIRHSAAAKLMAVGFIATMAASTTIAHSYISPSMQMETITVSAKRIHTERMATIIVSASRIANTWVAGSLVARASNAVKL